MANIEEKNKLLENRKILMINRALITNVKNKRLLTIEICYWLSMILSSIQISYKHKQIEKKVQTMMQFWNDNMNEKLKKNNYMKRLLSQKMKYKNYKHIMNNNSK